MKYLSLIGLFIVFQHITLAQIGYPIKPEDAQLIMKRKLLVITPEPDPEQIEKLQDKGRTQMIDTIEKCYLSFNEALKEALPKWWTIHPSATYKTLSEFAQMDKKTLNEYIVMYFINQISNRRQKYFYSPQLKVKGINQFNEIFPLITFTRAEDFGFAFGQSVYERKMPEAIPGTLSLYFTLKLINNHVLETSKLEKKITKKDEKIAVEANHKALKDKTLYIGEDWKDANFGVNQIKEIYPHKVEVVNQNVLVDKIRSNEENIAVHFAWPEVGFRTAPIGNYMIATVTFIHVIVDIQSGNILAVSTESRFGRLNDKQLQTMLE